LRVVTESVINSAEINADIADLFSSGGQVPAVAFDGGWPLAAAANDTNGSA
jgi:hypothetical protein